MNILLHEIQNIRHDYFAPINIIQIILIQLLRRLNVNPRNIKKDSRMDIWDAHPYHWIHSRPYLFLHLYGVLHQVTCHKLRNTYRLIGERNKNKRNIQQILDIGTATGGALKTIVPLFPETRILGIDYNPLYVPACQKLFKQHDNVEIRQMNYYDIEK